MSAEDLYVANANGVDCDQLTGSKLLDHYERAILRNARTEADPYADAEDRSDSRHAMERLRAAVFGAMVVA